MKKPKTELDTDDIELFRNAVKGTTPLKQDKVVHHRPGNKLARKMPASASNIRSKLSHNSYVDSDYVADVGIDENLLFSRSGLQHKMLKKFRKGQIPLQGRLDLHGLTVSQAAERLKPFLQSCHDQDKRSILLIHGRGHRSFDNKPILKSQLNAWLRNEPLVLAFCSAQPKHGGTGALYVLLKQNR